MYTVYATKGSGNCYKVQLLMRQLHIPFRIVDIDVLKGETQSPSYLAINPNGKVPYLVLPNGQGLGESNAMLLHLADGSDLMPTDPLERMRVHEWLFWEQSSHEPYISPARFWISIMPEGRADKADQIAMWHERGAKSLKMLDDHLSRHDFLVGDRYTVADIGLFGYTHVADEGEFDMSLYPAVCAWIDRVKAIDGYVPMMDFAAAA
ncbi:MAG: glutathione S-transferase family protein [Hyphomicrobiales bacterium]